MSDHLSSPSPDALQLRKEECRRSVRAYLAERQSLAFHPEDIRRGLNAGKVNDYGTFEVRAALTFLWGLRPPQVIQLQDSVGATNYYQATSEGVLAAEREGV